MSHGHGHGHGHGVASSASASTRHLWRMWVSLVILSAFAGLELVVGLLASSLALLSDAAHMVTDVIGLAMAVAAITAAQRPRTTPHRTFGLYRLEVLAALANALLLFGVAGWILYAALRRFAEPIAVSGLPVLLAAAAGLGANLVVVALLRHGAMESLNVRGAYLEVLADALSSVGVLVSGALTLTVGWRYADPVVAVAIGLYVLPRVTRLAGQALRILLQQAPHSLDVPAIEADLAALPGVQQVHDLHVWTLTSGMEVLTVHLRVTPDAGGGRVLGETRALLRERYGIEHVTIQIELPDDDGEGKHCHQLAW